MIKLITNLIKFSLFALAILVLGQIIKWDGRTISDQIKSRISHAEKAPIFKNADWNKMKKWTEEKIKKGAQSSAPVDENPSQISPSVTEEMNASERQKLRALIGELNHSSKQSN